MAKILESFRRVIVSPITHYAKDDSHMRRDTERQQSFIDLMAVFSQRNKAKL